MVIEKFAEKEPSGVEYDDKLLFYSRIVEDVVIQANPKVGSVGPCVGVILFVLIPFFFEIERV